MLGVNRLGLVAGVCKNGIVKTIWCVWFVKRQSMWNVGPKKGGLFLSRSETKRLTRWQSIIPLYFPNKLGLATSSRTQSQFVRIELEPDTKDFTCEGKDF